MSKSDDDIHVLGNWEELISATQRTSSTGKQRVTLEVKSEPLVFDFGEQRMAKPIADAIAESLREGLLTSNEPIAPSSTARRQAAATGYERGTKSARQEFTGGRTGPTPPNKGKAKGYNSGRLAKTIVAAWVEKLRAYVINSAANRLDPAFRARAPQFVEWLAGKLAASLKSERVAEGVKQSVNGIVEKVTDVGAALRKKILDESKAALDAARGLAGEAEQFGNEGEP